MTPIRVVIADDTPEIRLLVGIMLQRSGRFVVAGEAGDGAAAIQICGEVQPDIVVLDLAMPTMDGLQAIPDIRKAAPGAKICVLSGFDRTKMEPEALALGADVYLEKGVLSETLIETLLELAETT